MRHNSTLPVIDESWREDAACREIDPGLFFKHEEFRDDNPQKDAAIAAAKTVCADCVSKTPCLDYAIAVRQDRGVWGGMTGEERAQLARQRAAQRKANRRTRHPVLASLDELDDSLGNSGH